MVVIAPVAQRFVLVYAVAAAAWLLLVRRNVSLPVTITVAIALRVILLFPEPRLSGDVYRYLSDGRVMASGENPYTYYPSDPRINHPEIRSIYPPHAQLLFGLVHELIPWRVLILCADLLALALLRERAFAYATCPLVLFEGLWSGHLDAIAGVLVLMSLCGAGRPRPAATGEGARLYTSAVALGIASGLKLIPLAAVPALRRRGMKLLPFTLALLLPFVFFAGEPIMPGFREYATRWIFNSPLYDVVRWCVERIPTKEIWTHHPLRFELISDFVYRQVYADFLTRAILATLAIAAILTARRVTTAIAALLLCSPAIHPWYWLTLVPSALVERSAFLWVALAAPASYLLYDGMPPLTVQAICYGLPAFACAASRFSSSPSRSST
jgi:alpha-1,6-mannosyltransferase